MLTVPRFLSECLYKIVSKWKYMELKVPHHPYTVQGIWIEELGIKFVAPDEGHKIGKTLTLQSPWLEKLSNALNREGEGNY